jgi:hypothetical protein
MHMTKDNDQSLRDHLLSLLRDGNAHISFQDFIKDFPAERCAERVSDLPYTAWQVLEHMCIAQWDMSHRNGRKVIGPNRMKLGMQQLGMNRLRNFEAT